MDIFENISVSLTISGDNLDFSYIEENFPLPQKHNRKGTKLTSFLSVEVDNVIFDEFDHEENSSIDSQISNIILKLTPYKDRIKSLSKYYDIRLRIYTCSEMAQIFFSINEKTIQLISEFNMSLECSIFSEGMCLDDRATKGD